MVNTGHSEAKSWKQSRTLVVGVYKERLVKREPSNLVSMIGAQNEGQ